MRKQLIIFAFLILGCTSVAQTTKSYYNSGNTSTTKKFVGASWHPGIILLADGSELVGQVRGYAYKGNDISSFRYRVKKGDKARTIKAIDCQLISYDGFIILSLPKNLKKKAGKRMFYVVLYYGEHLTIFQNPKAEVASGYSGSITFNEGQMLSYLALKDGQISKITKLRFRTQMKNIGWDNQEFMKRTNDRSWFKYDNIYRIANFYNQTKNQ